MTSDYTSAVIRLETAYSAMQLARARAAAEVRAHYREVIKKEIEARQLAAEVEFARTLAIEHDAGLPGNVIRTEVLHTNDWNRWRKWRDLAGINPDRITRENAKEAKARQAQEESGYLWDEDYTTLTVTRSVSGVVLEEPVVYPMSTAYPLRGGKFWPKPTNDPAEDIAMEGYANATEYVGGIHEEISKQIEAGNVPDPRNN